ncbi:MAG: carbon-nitrogen hydrolase family protein [Firmicutes bacterium]|jgi:predicted amidohydrolase|nr:carbon-nitrogen hydrolase family protein [Bacillota bacterium]HPU02131.1 carbon-nitrogen hydrolase family protein [Bacillota bacterium]
MKVAALSLAGVPLENPAEYAAALAALLKQLQTGLAVLPAHTSFLLCAAQEQLVDAGDFAASFRAFMQKARAWNEVYLQMHCRLARENKLYLVPGTTIVEEGGRFFLAACLIDPGGRIIGWQRQTHLSREERSFGLSRGEELPLFDVEGMKAGLILGTDARHPEVGRILALQGAGLVIHCGAIATGPELAAQPAGIWAQVQQNQFWAVEAQLKGSMGGRTFGGRCAVLGPCEITPGQTGYLDRDAEGRPFAAAELREADRRRIKTDYPLLELLRPEAYRGRLPELYGEV